MSNTLELTAMLEALALYKYARERLTGTKGTRREAQAVEEAQALMKAADALMQEAGRPMLEGWDKQPYTIGDRVEIHPGTDYWMRGAKFGTVVGTSLTPNDRVRVQLDLADLPVSGSANSFRRIA